MDLLVATHNRHKLEELLALAARPGLRLLSLRDYPDLPDVVEDGATLEANARKKAISLAGGTGHWALADDTGLEVAALDGAPGVISARYAGENVDYAANNAKLLRELEGVTDRRACFRSVIALADRFGACHTVEGRCTGTIVTAPRGDHGFGYDPLFQPEGQALTFAQMPLEFKNTLSHRARALQAAVAAWAQVLDGAQGERW